MTHYENHLKKCKKCIFVKTKIGKAKYGSKGYWIYDCNLKECNFKLNPEWEKEIYNESCYNSESLLNNDETKGGKKKVVKRKKPEFEPVEEFDGEVEVVERISRKQFAEDIEEDREQYHMVMKPLDKKTIEAIKDSKTQRLHNYISISNTTTETEIAEGSNLDTFISEVEISLPETKKMKTHQEVMEALEGKSFHFVRKKIGKSYGGHEARSCFIPRTLIED